MGSAGPADRSLRLGFGQFLGRVQLGLESDGIAVRELAARPAHPGVPRHTHEHAHFCLVLSGVFATTTHNLEGRCGAAMLLFHPAGTTHEDRYLSPTGRCLTISLGPDVTDRFGVPRLPERSLALHDAEIGFPGSRMRCELRAPDSLTELSLEGLTLELIGRVQRGSERLGSGRPAWLARAVACLRECATAPARVTDIAEEAGVHPVHLARVFRKHLGLSPGEYLRRARVQAAMELVEQTSEPLATIALRAGFCDQSALTRAFGRELGTTPAAYRRVVHG